MGHVQLAQPRGTTKVFCKGTHVRAMIDTIFNARAFFRQEMVVWRVGGHGHLVGDERCPPHGLLLGNGRNGANTGPYKADEGYTGVYRRDDVAYGSVGCSGVRFIEEVE